MRLLKHLASTLPILLLATAASAQQISPYLTGTNVWYNPSDAVWAVHATAGHKIMRIGGHAYDTNVPTKEQLTIWVNKIKAMGAEPLIQVSQYQSAAAAADLVRYFNVETKNTVKFWGIGNEPWLQAGKPAMNTMPAKIAGYIKPAAIAMRDVDPTIKLFVVNECYYDAGLYKELFNSGSANDLGGKDPKGRWYVDGASWHRYNSGTAITGADDIIGSMQAARQNIDEANVRHGRTGADKLGWGIGEFNSDAGAGLPCSFGTGQMIAAVYGGAMRYEATFATMWSMLEGGGSCSGTDFSIIGNDLKPRSTFNHMQLVAKNMSGTYAHGTSNMGTNIFSYGSKSAKDVAAMILNRGGQAYTFKLRLDKQAVAGNVVNIDAGVDAEHSVTIPANTSMLLVFGLDGTLAKRYTYNATMATPKLETINEPPPPPVVVTPQPIPGKIEAESFFDSLGIQTEPTGDVAGGGRNVGWFDDQDWMDYRVEVATAGDHTVTFRVASPEGVGKFELRDSTGKALGNFTIPATGAFQTYTDVKGVVKLAKGIQTLRVVSLANGWNFNAMTFALGGLPVGVEGRVNSLRGLSRAYSSGGNLILEMGRMADERLMVSVITLDGTIVDRWSGTVDASGTRIVLGGGKLHAGTYLVEVGSSSERDRKLVTLAR
jgi:hypothetical protein